MQDKIIFAGGGGHALSLLEALPSDSDCRGYLAPCPSDGMPVEWLGNDSVASLFIAEGYPFHIAFIYAGCPVMSKRKELIRLYEGMGASFASIIAATAVVTRHSTLGGGSAVLNRAVINRAAIGSNSVVNSGAVVEHDCLIGANTFIGPGAVIGGGSVIGDDCFIGLGAKIRNGVTIASGVTVGMGSVVTRSIHEPGIYRSSGSRLIKIQSAKE